MIKEATAKKTCAKGETVEQKTNRNPDNPPHSGRKNGVAKENVRSRLTVHAGFYPQNVP